MDDMTPGERFVVMLAGLMSPIEIHRLALFFTEWDRVQGNPLLFEKRKDTEVTEKWQP